MPVSYSKDCVKKAKTQAREIFALQTFFKISNIYQSVLHSFDKVSKKSKEEDFQKTEEGFFNVLDSSILNKSSYCLEIGCGTGIGVKCFLNKVNFIEAIEPLQTIFTAKKLLSDVSNTRLFLASTNNIPFTNTNFDFIMSTGVIPCIRITSKAMDNCVKKHKIGGYSNLYYDFENKARTFKYIFVISNFIEKIVRKLLGELKSFICNISKELFYLPFILKGRFLNLTDINNWNKRIMLNG
jgi:ubiquinone/menaquinone biosynthesis C-methylase UbiE